MGMRVLPIESRNLWESFATTYCANALFQSWPWGQVAQALGSKVWRLGVFTEKNLVGVAQVTKIEAKRGKFLHIRHGPIFQSQTRAFWNGMLRYVASLAVANGCWFIRVSPVVDDSDKNRSLFRSLGLRPAPIHAMDAELCWVLDLDKSEEELLSSMRKTTRYEIRMAQEAKVNVRKSTDPRDVSSFLALYKATAERHDFTPHIGIREEFEIFAKERRAMLFLGEHERNILAGAIILFWGDQAIYHHGASLPSRIPVSHLVQWEAIKEAKKRGATRYNFWGIAPEGNRRHPWRGITVFKKGFGGKVVFSLHAHDLPVSPFYVVPRVIETIRRIQKGY